MNPPDQNHKNNGNYARPTPRLEAFMREQHEEQQRNRDRRNPPPLLEAFWSAESSGDNTANQRTSSTVAEPSIRRQQILQKSEPPAGVSEARQSVGATSSPSGHLQSILLALAAQQQRMPERQHLQQRQQSHNFVVGLPPRADSASASLHPYESNNESSRQLQRLMVLASQRQQGESRGSSRSANQSLYASPPAPPAAPGGTSSSSVDTTALLRLLALNEGQQHAQEQYQHQPSNCQLGTSGSFQASAMRQLAMLVAAHAQSKQEELLQQRQQHLLQSQVSRSPEESSAGSSGQVHDYLQHLHLQLQLDTGSSTTGRGSQQTLAAPGSAAQPSLQPQMTRNAMDAATSRFLEGSSSRLATTSRAVSQINQLLGTNAACRGEEALPNAQGSGNNHGATTAPMFFAASRILPLGAAHQSPYRGQFRVNSSYLPSILQGLRQEAIHLENKERSKRKLDDMENEGEEKKPAAKPSGIKASFPLPSLKSARNVHRSKLLSFQHLWDELEDSEMQDEIFRRRICGDIRSLGIRVVSQSTRPDVDFCHLYSRS